MGKSAFFFQGSFLNRRHRRFLGCVDLRGTTWQSTTIATGYGGYIAQPLLRKAVEGREDTLTEQEAIKILDDCMRVLFYRDARSLNRVCFIFGDCFSHLIDSFNVRKSPNKVWKLQNLIRSARNGPLLRIFVVMAPRPCRLKSCTAVNQDANALFTSRRVLSN